MRAPLIIHVERHRSTLLMAAAVAILILAHVAGMIVTFGFGYDDPHGMVRLFNLGREKNIPTFFSSFFLLLCAFLLFLVYRQSRLSERKYSVHWLVLGVLFVFLAVDEFSALHERLIQPLRTLLPEWGVLHFAWIVPYGLATVVLFSLYLGFLLSLQKKVRRLFIAAAALYLLGAVGLEMIGGHHFLTMDLANKPESAPPDLPYALLEFIEESLELSGIVLFANALLLQLGLGNNRFPLRIYPPPSPSSPP